MRSKFNLAISYFEGHVGIKPGQTLPVSFFSCCTDWLERQVAQYCPPVDPA